MRKYQRGVSLGGLIVGLFILVIAAMLGLKVAPAYMEFSTLKSTITRIATEQGGGSPRDIRRSFESAATIDNIESVKAADLEITKEGGQVVISVAYRKEVKLFGNITLCIDFNASSLNP